MIKENMEKQLEWCDEAPFYTLGPLTTDIAPGYDYITSATGAAMIGKYGCAMLCYVTPKEHLGLPNKKDVKDGVIVTKSLRTPPICQRPSRKRNIATTQPAKRASNFVGKINFSHSIPRPREFHDETLPQEGAKLAHFCSMCGPHFCSMKITEDVRRYAAEKGIDGAAAIERGLQEKATEFQEAGAEIYAKT
jgi:phosphomethylpyrimidine synthase